MDEADPATGTQNVDLAHDHAGATREYFKAVHARDSIDGSGMTINVNYGVDFLNAFWDGTRLTLGNGDGRIFVDFAQSPDVVGHEFSHGVVEHTANLDYQSQSGALNESFADVFGSLVEQRMKGEDFASANWLIGDEIMAPDLYDEALRSMAHPGTAYDNAVLGKDPQPGHMDEYYAGPDDNQGVHNNSGIINRAFYLTASELGTDGAGGSGTPGRRTCGRRPTSPTPPACSARRRAAAVHHPAPQSRCPRSCAGPSRRSRHCGRGRPTRARLTWRPRFSRCRAGRC